MKQNVNIIAQLIMTALNEDCKIYEAAQLISQFACASGTTSEMIDKIAVLATTLSDINHRATTRKESVESKVSYHLCHALIGIATLDINDIHIIKYPSDWPYEPKMEIGKFIKGKGTIEGIIRDGIGWLYFVRGLGWISEDDLLREEEPTIIKTDKLDNEPTTQSIYVLHSDFDPFMDGDELP